MISWFFCGMRYAIILACACTRPHILFPCDHNDTMNRISTRQPLRFALLLMFLLASTACSNNQPNTDANNAPRDMGGDVSKDMGEDLDESADLSVPDFGPIPEDPFVFEVASSCYALRGGDPNDSGFDSKSGRYLSASEDGFSFSADTVEQASALRWRASDLGTYLLYDEQAHYLVVEDAEANSQGGFERKKTILSDILKVDDSYLPGAQWVLHASPRIAGAYHLRHLKSGRYMTTTGVEEGLHKAAALYLEPKQGCADYPELTLDASGEVYAKPYDDGSVYGIVETHTHIFTNFGFGGGGIFHGSAFHPFGVEHALPSCELFHGEEGRKDLFGFGYDKGSDLDPMVLLESLVTGRTPEFNHFTDGYPKFTEWPSGPFSSTHQTQYYKWIERAYMGGLRLMVQHATSNKVICDLIAGQRTQPTRYGCGDMVAADRIIEETYRMERYIDAQHGGPGKGWFRVVTSPEEARRVINEGKLAIVLGLELSHLFDCLVVPFGDDKHCTEQDVLNRLDQYWNLGVRVLFPVHKYDNGFSAGDGSRELIEVGNFAQSGHYSNFTEDCPDQPVVFDKGNVALGALNIPRDQYISPPPVDMSGFPRRPVFTLLRHRELLMGGSLQGDFCQNAGLTPLGSFLIEQLMRRGMIIELDHFPRRSYAAAFAQLAARDYPGVGSHGNNNDGKLYDYGGVSKIGFGGCSDPNKPGGRLSRLKARMALLEQKGQYSAEGLGFDWNGFASIPKPRFGPRSSCTNQQNPVTYPFKSQDGNIMFTQPVIGERMLDFNNEGLVHIGLLPEFLEDLRNDGATEKEMEGLFRSAEGYLRMWEKAERRGRSIVAQDP